MQWLGISLYKFKLKSCLQNASDFIAFLWLVAKFINHKGFLFQKWIIDRIHSYLLEAFGVELLAANDIEYFLQHFLGQTDEAKVCKK